MLERVQARVANPKVVSVGGERVKAEIALRKKNAPPVEDRHGEARGRTLLADQSYQQCTAGYRLDVVTLDSLLAAINDAGDAKLQLCKSGRRGSPSARSKSYAWMSRRK